MGSAFTIHAGLLAGLLGPAFDDISLTPVLILWLATVTQTVVWAWVWHARGRAEQE